MKRKEQQDRLSEIVESIDRVISTLRDHTGEYDDLTQQFNELHDKLEADGYQDIFLGEIDCDQFAYKLSNSILENQTEIDATLDLLYDFETDIEEDMSELSGKKLEELEDRYSDLRDDVIDSLNTMDDEFTVYSMIDLLTEKMNVLQDMRDR